MTFTLFASVVAIYLAAAISPGPSFVVSLRVAAAEGFGVALALGFGLGAVLWATAAMAGLAVLFELVPALFSALKLVGAGFLLFIAFMMWKHAAATLAARSAASRPRGTWAAVRFGFLTFATNPKPAIFFGAVFVNETLWYIVVARVFSLSRARNAYTNTKAWIDRGFGTLIALFGLKIALT